MGHRRNTPGMKNWHFVPLSTFLCNPSDVTPYF